MSVGSFWALAQGPRSDEVMTSMARVVVIGDLMTDAVAHAMLPLARGSDTPASVTMHGGGSGANVAAWMAADGGDVAFVGRRGQTSLAGTVTWNSWVTASMPGW